MTKDEIETKIDEHVQELQKQYLHMHMIGKSPKELMDFVSVAFRNALTALANTETQLHAYEKKIPEFMQLLPPATVFAQISPPDDLTQAELDHFWKTFHAGEHDQLNTPVGISVFFRENRKVIVKRIDGYIFPGNPQQAIDEIMPQIVAIAQKTPIEADIGNQYIEGLSNADILRICTRLSHYWYIDTDQYPDMVLSLFDEHWQQIADAIQADGMQDSKRRRDAKKHFKNVIKRTFKACEKRLGNDGN